MPDKWRDLAEQDIPSCRLGRLVFASHFFAHNLTPTRHQARRWYEGGLMTSWIVAVLCLAALAAAMAVVVYRRGRDRMYASLAGLSSDSACATPFEADLSHAHAQTLAPSSQPDA